jgi:hypothetical protein
VHQGAAAQETEQPTGRNSGHTQLPRDSGETNNPTDHYALSGAIFILLIM